MKIDYQPGLDGLRGVAVVLVLVFHSDLGWLPGGFLGVSVFFTLSGFLITSLLVSELGGAGRIDLAGFWERRFRRLLPAALVTIVGACVAALWFSTPVEQSRLRGDAVASILYVGNWRAIFADLSYEEIFSTSSPLIHLWSLAIEEQMYILVPVLVVVIAAIGWGRRALVLAALVLAALSTIVSFAFTDGDRLYYGTDTRAAELLVGVAAAALIGPRILGQEIRLPRIARWGAPLALVVVVVLARTSSTNSEWVYGGLLPAFALVSVVCVIGAITVGPMRTLLSTGPLVSIGRISYGLYLFHWPIFTWIDADRVGFTGIGLFAVRLIVTIVVTWVSYTLIEQPIRQRRLFRTRRMFAAAAVCAMSVALAIPLIAFDSVSGTPDTDVRVLSTVPATIAEQSRPTGQLRILVIGDSTAENVARALAEIESFGIVSAGVLGCPLVPTTEVFDRPQASQETSYCPDNVGIVRDRATDIDLLLVVGGVSNQWAYRDPMGSVVEPGSPDYQRDFDRLMEDLHDALAPAGVPIIVLDNPRTRPDDGVLGDDEASHGAWRSQIERWDRQWATVARISIDDALAPADSEEGRAQRPDGVHLDEEFAAELARTALGPDLRTAYDALIDEIDRIGCRVVTDRRPMLVLERCGST